MFNASLPFPPPSAKTMGVSSIPPGGCQLLYEEGVARAWSLPILAWGPGMKTMGGGQRVLCHV